MSSARKKVILPTLFDEKAFKKAANSTKSLFKNRDKCSYVTLGMLRKITHFLFYLDKTSGRCKNPSKVEHDVMLQYIDQAFNLANNSPLWVNKTCAAFKCLVRDGAVKRAAAVAKKSKK